MLKQKIFIFHKLHSLTLVMLAYEYLLVLGLKYIILSLRSEV